MNSANDHLLEYFGTSCYHRYLLGNLLTDGVVALAHRFHCLWFLDIVCSYTESLSEYEYQVWTLQKSPDSSAKVTCTDGNKNLLVQQEISWTDFAVDLAVVWKEGNVILLPSEH